MKARSMRRSSLIGVAVFVCSVAASRAARAEPREGRLPSRAGEAFSGQVRYIGDGDSLCVGQSSDPAT